MPRSSRPTIRDVARAAGVSAGVASVVLNDPGQGTPRIRVGEATRERVLEAARALQYEPNFVARALSGHSRLIGVALDQPPPRPDFFQRYVVALQRELYARGYHVLLGLIDAQSGALARWMDECRRHCAAGVLLVASGRLESQLRAEGLATVGAAGDPPCVIVGSDVGLAGDAAVCIDHRGAGRALAAHLLALGHRRFLHVGPGVHRLAGCREALAAAGLSPDEALIQWPPDLSPEGVGDAAQVAADQGLPLAEGPDWPLARGRWIVHQVYHGHGTRRGDWPTAMIANNDRYAAGALAGLRELGLRVPEDVAVVGCDNDPFGAYLPVPLTTVEYHVPEIARRAVALLLEAIERRRSGQPLAYRQETVPATLVVRRSCGAYVAARATGSVAAGGEQ